MFHGILPTGDQSATAQQRASALNNAIDTDDNDSDDTNNPEDASADNTVDNNPVPRATSNSNPTRKRKSVNAGGDELASKRAKVTGGHVLAESIVAVVEEMRASREERQEAVAA